MKAYDGSGETTGEEWGCNEYGSKRDDALKAAKILHSHQMTKLTHISAVGPRYTFTFVQVPLSTDITSRAEDSNFRSLSQKQRQY